MTFTSQSGGMGGRVVLRSFKGRITLRWLGDAAAAESEEPRCPSVRRFVSRTRHLHSVSLNSR